MEIIIYGVVGLLVGAVVAFVVQNVVLKSRKDQILKEAEKEGENLKQKKILQAKEKFLKLKEDHERKIKDRERKLQSSEDRVRNKEKTLSQKIEETNRKDKSIQKTKSSLDAKLSALDKKHSELDKMHQKTVAELSKVSGMSPEDAKAGLVEALKDEGLPEELSWLPLIESGYQTRALSRARALGMWQFIASTGYKFGLERNDWIDERMDPEKSTRAAIAYLKELHGIFGDWTTALAAYNCGEGNVLKAIKRQKIKYLDDFWDLYTSLPRETASYVPRFLAVLHIINDPAAHGITLPPVEEPVRVDKITVSKQMDLKKIAQNIGSSYQEMKSLNPELRKNVTPGTSYDLKVPAGKGEVLLAQLPAIPVWVAPTPSYVVHRVRRGESLSVIACRYGTSVRAIMNMNGLRRSSYIKQGWKLKVPTGKRTYKTHYSAKATKGSGNSQEYVVRKGDSLWKIANRFGTTTKALKSLNHMQTTRLDIGQVIMIP